MYPLRYDRAHPGPTTQFGTDAAGAYEHKCFRILTEVCAECIDAARVYRSTEVCTLCSDPLATRASVESFALGICSMCSAWHGLAHSSLGSGPSVYLDRCAKCRASIDEAVTR